MIRYYYPGVDPEQLSTKKWAEAVAYLEIIRQQELEGSQAQIAALFSK
jgi:hypothetical protein